MTCTDYLARANQEREGTARKSMVEWRPDERRAPRLEQSALELRVLLPSASRHRSVSGHPASDETFEVQTREQPDSPRII
jgi:hypothetical protein